MAVPIRAPAKLNSVLEIIDNYQGILLDQFGVLHDGQNPYPKAIPVIRTLAQQRNQKLLVVSNSSRRAGGALNKIQQLGFHSSDFYGAITSGEITHQVLENRPDQFWQSLGNKCIHITWGSRGTVSLEGLGLQLLGEDECAGADFILAHGTESISTNSGSYTEKSIDGLKKVLENCIAQNDPPIPMLVANPDKVTVAGTQLAVMPGTLSDHYQSLGGPVFLMGKPDPIIYQEAMEILDVEKSKLLAIGDSLEHDIMGAQQLGIDQLFIVAGIHAEAVKFDQETNQWDDDLFNRLIKINNIDQPTYAMGYLQ